MLEYSLIKQHQPRFNVRLRRRQELPVPRRHRSTTSGPGRWSCGAASARASATSGPTATPTPSARPSTCCCAPSRSAPARTTSSSRHQQLGRPCLLFHIEKCSGPCVGEIDKERLRRARRRAARVPRRRHRHGRQAARDAQMREAADELEFERAARLRDRLASVRKAIEKQQMVADRNEDLDVDRHRRRRARGRGPGVLRAPGPGGRAARASSSTRSRTSTPGELVGRVLEGLYDEPPPLGMPKQVLVPDEPDDLDLYEEWLAEPRRLDGRRSGCRSGATSGRCRRRSPATPRRSSSATGCAGVATTTAGPGRSTSCRTHLGLPEAPLRIECYDMSHIQGTDYVGSMVVMEDGAARRSPSTGASRSRASPATTTSPPWRRCSPGGSPPTWPSGDRPVGRAARASSPTRRSCCWSTAARASSAWPCGCSRSSGLDEEIPVAVAGQAVRGGLRARRRPTRSASPASPRRSTCCSASATRPTASPSPTTASCAASA